MSHVDNDKDIQSGELPNEDTIGHKALIFRGNKADISGAEGNVIDIISIDVYRKDKLDCGSVGEGVAECE